MVICSQIPKIFEQIEDSLLVAIACMWH